MYEQGEELWAKRQQRRHQSELMSHDGKSIWVSLTERNLLAPLGDSVHRHFEAGSCHCCRLANHPSII
jgi:hypothetical protein